MTNVTREQLETWIGCTEAGLLVGLSSRRIKQVFDQGLIRGVKTALGTHLDPESVIEWAKNRRHQNGKYE